MLNVNIDGKRLETSASVIKMIAIVLMFVDHFAASLIGTAIIPTQVGDVIDWNALYMFMRNMGRFAFPVFCLFIAEGFKHTSNTKKYLIRLAVFAAISEIPFDMCLYGKVVDFHHNNVFFTLSIGLLAMILIDRADKSTYRGLIFTACVAAGTLGGAQLLHTDYAAMGVLLLIAFYYLKDTVFLRALVGVAFMLYETIDSQTINQWVLIPAASFFVLVYLYRGNRGRQFKWFFYIFYPGHLLVLGIVRMINASYLY